MSAVSTHTESRSTFTTQKIPVVVKYSLRVIIRDDWIKSDGTCALCLQAFIDGRKDVLPLNVWVEPKNFDKQAQKVIHVKEHQSDLNLIIRKGVALANEIMLRYRMMEKPLSREKFKEEFSNPASRHDFFQFFDRELEKRKSFQSDATFGIHSTTLKKLKGFKVAVRFSDLNRDFISQFDLYLKNKCKHKINTIHKYMKTLKVYVRLALREKLITEYPFDGYKLKTEQTARTFLDKEEFKKLINYFNQPYCPPHHQRVLRYFLFGCLTGLRISDVKRVTWNNIIGDELVFLPKKTETKMLRIPLGEFANMLLTKKGHDEKLFNTTAGQKTNIQLQKIAARLEINKHITFHVARHTFATLMLKEGGAVQVLKELLGHSKLETTMIYVHIVGEDRRDHVNLLDNLAKNISNAV